MKRLTLLLCALALAGCASDPDPPVGGLDAAADPGAHGPADSGSWGDGPVPIQTGPVTVVTLGDSLTEGVGDSEWTPAGVAVGYPGRLEYRLRLIGVDATVHNLGRSGWTSGDLVDGTSWDDPPQPSQISLALPLLSAAVAKGEVAVATLWIGSNDLFGLHSWCHAPDNAGCEADDLAAYTANVTSAVTQLRATGAEVVVALLDDQSKRPVLADPAFADSFPDIGAAERPLMSAQVSAYNAALTALAASEGATTVTFFGSAAFLDPALLASDGNHPSAAGYEAITSVWMEAVQPLVMP
jgi:lysophospholipase L1-like esterase